MIKRILLCFVAFCSVSLAGTFNRQSAGLIKGARLSWVSGTAIKVGVGYGENAGEYWEIAPADNYNTTGYALAGLTTTTNGVFHYIYIDKANSLFPAITLTNSTTVPAWSDSYMGWYNGQNRCIGAVWAKADGTLANFFCSSDDTYTSAFLRLLIPSGAISTTYGIMNTVDYSAYAPVNAERVSFALSAGWNWSGTQWQFCRVRLLPVGGQDDFYADGSINAFLFTSISLTRGDAKQLQWMAWANTTNGVATLVVRGYKLER
jgi:hypothetical protein